MAALTFALDVRKWVTKAKLNGNVVLRKLLFDMSTSVVEMSPVGNPSLWKHKAPAGYVGGRFRGNWQFGAGEIPSGTLEDIDPEGGQTLGRLQRLIASAEVGTIHFIVNNLPYSIPLERGWSKQAPAGMVEVTVMQYRGFVRRAAAET